MSPVAEEWDSKSVSGRWTNLQPVASVLVGVLEAGQAVLSNGRPQQREGIYIKENVSLIH